MARPDSERISRIAVVVCFGLGSLLTFAWLIGKAMAWWFGSGD